MMASEDDMEAKRKRGCVLQFGREPESETVLF